MEKIDFDRWADSVHQSLFHVEKTDMHDELEIRLDQFIVLHSIIYQPQVLKYKPLKEILTLFDVLE